MIADYFDPRAIPSFGLLDDQVLSLIQYLYYLQILRLAIVLHLVRDIACTRRSEGLTLALTNSQSFVLSLLAWASLSREDQVTRNVISTQEEV